MTAIFEPGVPVLRKTEDGSHTLFLPHLNETYHSDSGALTESLHVFLAEGLQKLPTQPLVRVLEVGFGTGLNAILTALDAAERKQHIIYHTLEPYPIGKDLATSLELGFVTQNPSIRADLLSLHSHNKNESLQVNPFFSFTRIEEGIQTYVAPQAPYDILYYDAFAPRKQPEMWTVEVLEKCRSLLREGGIFITYCANGQFKRNLKALGFVLENPPGIKGRREITRGTLIHH